jgi:hypothetical protein
VSLPGLTIHGGSNKFVEATGKVCLTDGILDFVAVETGGREYESMFAIDCKPSALQFALLLIGCETNRSEIVMEVEWTVAGQTRRAPVERFLLDRRTKKPAGTLAWEFNGSRFVMNPVTEREEFSADNEMAHVAVVPSDQIPINVRGDFGNPYRGDDQGFEINTALVPPKDTPVTLIFRKREK